MNEMAATARFAAFAGLAESEVELLKSLAGPRRALDRGEVLRREGETSPGFYLLVSGWTASSMTDPDGDRHLLKIHMPGDMLGLPSLALKHAADTISALSPSVVHSIPLRSIGRLFEESPRLAAMLFLVSQEERVMLLDRLATTCRTSAMEKVAALFLQLHARSSRGRDEAEAVVRHPLTQSDLADLAGISLVQVNRTLQHLRADGVVTWARGEFAIREMVRLREIAGIPERELSHDLGWMPKSR